MVKSAKVGTDHSPAKDVLGAPSSATWLSRSTCASRESSTAPSSFGYEAIYALLGDIPLKGDEVLCDIGGGRGTLVAIFAEHYPNVSALVLDQEGPAKRAKENFAEKEVKGDAFGGSFLEKFPAAFQGCDFFLMKHILHNWPDSEAVTILKNIKQAAKPGSQLLVVEMIIDEGSALTKKGKRNMDLNMQAVMKNGARERSTAEYKALFKKAGIEYTLAKLIPTRAIVGAIQVPL